jgi:hypothetical protein
MPTLRPETPLHTVRYLAQAILCGIVRQNDPEEYGPPVGPVLANVVPDTHNIGPKCGLDLPHFLRDLLSLANGCGQHVELSTFRITHGHPNEPKPPKPYTE